jgi:4-diphosphocytidyl-2-C-methyl-D-erythritol kinase
MTSHPVSRTAPCKINLFLVIHGLLEDGYHELTTLFWPLPEPADRLDFSPGRPGTGLTLTCSLPGLEGADNLVSKAYAAFAAQSGFAPDLEVHLEKNIPAGMGLGGGSSDAAAMLAHLESIAAEQAQGAEALSRMAAELGADVPFFLQDGPALARGKGEILEPADTDLAGFSLVLLTPDIHISTARAYAAWDRIDQDSPRRRSGNGLLTKTRQRFKDPLCPGGPYFHNSLEQAVLPAHPRLRQIKGDLYRHGAAAAFMSGSGAAMCGLFRDPGVCADVARTFVASGVPARTFAW